MDLAVQHGPPRMLAHGPVGYARAVLPGLDQQAADLARADVEGEEQSAHKAPTAFSTSTSSLLASMKKKRRPWMPVPSALKPISTHTSLAAALRSTPSPAS